ncbi:PAS domain-containing protein [Hymenobacter sp. NST-14]|uniref:PAS domain-containing protein n=1 Tax=Hymenobacter piscis TaxID=2839984 RepID=UPI001C0135F8|nr:PAS domain-containing protein [Hymenobacter piscis]MBT9393251.1 PAS domain-containing protein [Hymenobacter piscis]
MPPEQPDFQLLFEATPTPHLVLTPGLTLVALNDAMRRLLGRRRPDVIGRSILELLPDPVGTDHLAAVLAEVVRLRQPRQLEPLRYEQPNATVRYWQVLLRPLSGPSGELRYLLGQVLDVTEQVQAREQHQISHENFSTLARATHDAVWEYDLSTGQIWRNEMFTQLFGHSLTPETSTLDFWQNLLHPDDRPRLEASLQALHTGPVAAHGTSYRLRRADGEWAEVTDRYHVIRDAAGKPLRLLGAMQDVTQSRANERALHRSLHQFRLLADFIPQLVWLAEADGRVSYVNQRWQAYTGLAEHPANWLEVIHPADHALAAARWTQATHHGTPYQCELRLRDQAGAYRWFLCHARPEPPQDAAAPRWFGTCTDIEDQKRTQQRLERQDRQLQLILGQVPAFIATLSGPEHTVEFINQRFNNLLGGQVPVGRPARQAAPVLAGQGLFELLDMVHAQGRPLHRQEQLVRLPDETGQLRHRYFDFVCQPLPPLPGQAATLLTFAVEVTDRVRTRQRLDVLDEEMRRRNEQLRILTESIPQITSSARPDGQMDYLSPQWFSYTGQTMEDLSQCWRLALHPDDLPHCRQAFCQAVATGRPFDLELRLRRHDGQYRWHLSRSVPAFDASGQVSRLYGYCTDVHDQRLLAEELGRSEEQFRFLAETIPAIVWTARPDGQLDYLNARWTFHTGLDTATTLREGFFHLLPEQETENVRLEFEDCIRTGRHLDLESRLLDVRSRQYRWYLHRAHPLRDAAGRITRWFGTTTDIDDYKRVQQRLEEKNHELTRTNQDLDSFVYAVSHDLRQPITNMAGIFEELIRTAFFRDPDAVKLIAMFEKALHQIYGTIHDLSELVRLQQLRHEQPAERLPLQELAREVLTSVQSQMETSRSVIQLNFAAVPELLFVRPHLQSILYNLLSNALKYAAPGRRPRIRLSAFLEQGQPVLTVQDNGLGIDLDRFGPELFQLFRRFHDHVDGSGMGLYLVNRMVQDAGGQLSVTSTVGAGSTFRVQLPASALPV